MENCKGCQLFKSRKRIVKNRGFLFAPILIITDYPDVVDESFGYIMAGEKEKLLNMLFEDAFKIIDIVPKQFFITSLLRCRPTNRLIDGTREPTSTELLSCIKNLIFVLSKARFKYIFLIGELAEKYCIKEFPDATVLQSIRFLLGQGGPESVWYKHNVRLITEGLQ